MMAVAVHSQTYTLAQNVMRAYQVPEQVGFTTSLQTAAACTYVCRHTYLWHTLKGVGVVQVHCGLLHHECPLQGCRC